MVSCHPCHSLRHHCLRCHSSYLSARYLLLLLHMNSNNESVSDLFCMHSCGLYKQNNEKIVKVLDLTNVNSFVHQHHHHNYHHLAKAGLAKVDRRAAKL